MDFEGLRLVPDVRTDAFRPISNENVVTGVWVAHNDGSVHKKASADTHADINRKFAGMTYGDWLKEVEKVAVQCAVSLMSSASGVWETSR